MSDIEDLLKKNGIPHKKVKIKMNPKLVKAVRDYIMEIEEAHRRAGKSKLFFK